MGIQRGSRCTAAAVDEVRAALTSPEPADRSDALSRITAWRTLDGDPATASALLVGATRSYPTLPGQREDPAAWLAEALWLAPDAADLRELEATYLLASEAARRSLLGVLARRRDAESLDALRHLIGGRCASTSLPLPAPGVLSPVLGHPGVASLAPTLARLTMRPGWESEATDLLIRLVGTYTLDPVQEAGVLDVVRGALDSLVVECDLGCAPGVDRPADWRLRHRVRGLVDVLEAVGTDDALDLLGRVQASADPVLSAWAVAARCGVGDPVPWDRVWMAAHEPVSRSVLIDALDRRGQLHRTFDDAGLVLSGARRAEADLVSWLERPGELGCVPDEVEHIWTRPVPIDGVAEARWPAMHLFRFRVRAPHWSCATGWMVGAAGLYRNDGTVPDDMLRVAHSLFEAEDSASPEDHLDAIAASLTSWPSAAG